MTLNALQAGKHIYLKKPTSHNPAGTEMLIRAALEYNRIVQEGNQRRSWPNVIEAIQAIHAGEIGEVHHAKSWYANNRPSIGRGRIIPIPEWLDWETPDMQQITYQFGNDASCSWEGRSCNATPADNPGVGTAYSSEKGTLFINGGNEYLITDMSSNTVREVKSRLKFEEENLLNPSEQLDAIHFQNRFDAIRKGERLNSGTVDACISTQLVQLGNIAQHVGHSQTIDPMTGRIVDDPQAEKLWNHTCEKGREIRV